MAMNQQDCGDDDQARHKEAKRLELIAEPMHDKDIPDPHGNRGKNNDEERPVHNEIPAAYGQ
jgi:hypothetical protein